MKRLLFVAPAIVVVAVALASFLLLRSDDDPPASAKRGCTAEELAYQTVLAGTPTPTPQGIIIDFEALNRASQEAAAHRFLGQICGFEVVATNDEARPGDVCPDDAREFQGGADGPPPTFVPSELNKPNMTEQTLCKGGPVFAVYSQTGRRSYFKDVPRISFNGTREQMRIVQVDGREVLLVLPTFQLAPTFFASIVRPPQGSKPGILVAGMSSAIPPNGDVLEAVRKALAE